ncbi:tRNA1(Val) (adenine(37)-N6)-methyltransferase [Geomonas anaerohicana]|uniref:tRNA1(Val) (Adenine(37)-N6)-methyltransferase n=1 Tax=Geomonas anaerohicana TaxID=2798583 RepID=A0ABS0YIW1_9BACT|nr:tRNA1(Val) (adenine(37)-N6)-methyltransferase [Geomonas anaerohicana]MBJ6752182.1 tRNA1(Val) (adenine(37)-N6)-methyltransferase [Geomonas anaerohicana]
MVVTTELETLDELSGYDLRIIQPRHGYRFSVDPLLLADFSKVRDGESCADLGTGCGVIALLLARLAQNSSVTAIEFQQVMADIANRNVALNSLTDRVRIVEDDVLSLKTHFPVDSFDLVVSNPPYRRPGTGKISPRAGRDEARHETSATLADFLAAAKYLVKPSGRICLIYHTCRLAELMAQAAQQKLAPLRLRMVHGNSSMDARMFMIELAKGRTGELKVEPPLMVRGEAGGYSEEKKRIYRGRG